MKIVFTVIALSMLIASVVSGCGCEDKLGLKKAQEFSVGSTTVTLYPRMYTEDELLLCRCQCYGEFRKGQEVYDVINGSGIVESISNKRDITYAVTVKFNDKNYKTRTYTRDGRRFQFDKYPSLYPHKMKIVPE